MSNAGHSAPSRWISLAEAVAATLVVIGCNVLRVLPNSVLILFFAALISFRLREGSWATMGIGLPKSWRITVLIAIAAAVVQQAVGQFVADPLTQPFAHYSPKANPIAGIHGTYMYLRWFGIIWTYAAFGEEISYRGYLLNRVADVGDHSRVALFFGLLWSSVMFGFAHWYQGPAGVISAASSGLVFGAAYVLSGRNLWVAILSHGFSDSLALLAVSIGLAA